MSTTLDIKIQGREYRVACAAGETDSLLAAAELLNARMDEISKATRAKGERLAVMVALNLAHELNLARQDKPAVTDASNPIDAAEVRRRIRAIEAQLDEALSPQNELF